MNALREFIVKRMKCRFHPYLSPNARWRHYPPHMAKLLKDLNPLHIITVTDKITVIDGVYVKDERSMREKYSIARDAASALFGEIEEKICVAGNCEVLIHKSGCASISLFWGTLWYLVPSIPLKAPRFACKIDATHRNSALFPYEESDGGDCLNAVVLVDEEEKAELSVSEQFFNDPKPENVATFGDLCFLTQMRDGWRVEKEIPVEYRYEARYAIFDDMEEIIAKVLKGSIGLKSFINHGLMEIMIKDREDPQIEFWRRFLQILEKEKRPLQKQGEMGRR